jgi:hypothetical protein
MSEEVPVLVQAPSILPDSSCNEPSINNIFNMLVELVKKNKLMTFFIIVLIGVIIYYFIKVKPFKGSAFTHDHDHYHHSHEHIQQSQQQHIQQSQQQHIQQQHIQQQQSQQQHIQQQQPQTNQEIEKMLMDQVFRQQEQFVQPSLEEEPQRQLPNQLIQNPLDQVKQPIHILNDVDETDHYDVVPENGMKLDLKARSS